MILYMVRSLGELGSVQHGMLFRHVTALDKDVPIVMV
jgi:hypothetical protein